jgi:hypothetical protein
VGKEAADFPTGEIVPELPVPGRAVIVGGQALFASHEYRWRHFRRKPFLPEVRRE